MRFGSVCSGIEAASVAWHPLGWRASFLSEIEAFPRSVLSHHYPEVSLHGDFTTIRAGEYEPIGLLVGGTPCQSFSVAGLRGGMDDDRGNLALEYLRLADRLRPRWLVWENVPGVLSSNGGRDFGSILGGMGELGYGVAYRVLDAQFFGVAQRRRRVFVVGYLGDWRRAAAVLFERHSLSGHPAPRREARKAAPIIPSRSSAGGGLGTDFDCDGGLISTEECADTLTVGANQTTGFPFPSVVASTGETPHCLNAGGMGHQDYETETLIAHAFDARQSDVIQYGDMTGPLDTEGSSVGVMCFSAKDHGADAMSDLSPTLRAGGHSKSHANAGVTPTIAFQERGREGGRSLEIMGDLHPALTAPNGGGRSQEKNIMAGSAVRRLTPRECERLQGFPDDYTAVPHRGKPAADGPRYKALGNSMAVPVMRWIGERIAAVEALTNPQAANGAAAPDRSAA